MILLQGKTRTDGLTKEYFHELLAITLSKSLVLFLGKYHQQIDGVALGSALGPTVANIFLISHGQI